MGSVRCVVPLLFASETVSPVHKTIDELEEGEEHKKLENQKFARFRAVWSTITQFINLQKERVESSTQKRLLSSNPCITGKAQLYANIAEAYDFYPDNYFPKIMASAHTDLIFKPSQAFPENLVDKVDRLGGFFLVGNLTSLDSDALKSITEGNYLDCSTVNGQHVTLVDTKDRNMCNTIQEKINQIKELAKN